MENVLELFLQFSIEIRDFMWGNWMVALLVFTGVILTMVTGVIQIRKLIPAFKLVLQGARGKDYDPDEEGDISPFAALMTALAATVGNGNIAGVATAIATGGQELRFGCGFQVFSVWRQSMQKAISLGVSRGVLSRSQDWVRRRLHKVLRNRRIQRKTA